MPLCASSHASLSVAQVFVESWFGMVLPSCVPLVPFVGLCQPAPSLVNSMVFETFIIDSSGICQAVKPCSLGGSGGVFNTSYDNGCGNVLPPSAGPSVAHCLLLHMMNMLVEVTLLFPGSSLVFMLVFNAVAAMIDGRGSTPVCVCVALCPPCFQPSLAFAAMLWYQVGLCVASACPAYDEFWNFLLFPVAFVGKASVRMTNKTKGKDRSELKLRSFVTWFCSFPLPQMVTCGLQLCASAAAHVYFSCQIVSAAAVACGAQFVGFGIQAYVKVSASVFVRQFLFAIVESYDQGAAALQSVMVQIVAAARLVSAVARTASFGILTLVINGTTWSMGTTTLSKGSSYAATAAATPRLDVDKTPQAAAAPKYLLASSGHVWTEFRGLPGPGEKFLVVEEEGKHGGGNWEKHDSFFVFVVSLGESSMQVRVEGSDSYQSLAAKVAAKVNIPERHWYLTFSGKDLRHVLRPTSVLKRDSTVRMCSGLLGGATLQPTPGEWFCPACDRGGCRASRRTCFRCLAPRPAGGSTPLQLQPRGLNQRERRALGREPLRSPNQCPTERRAPSPPNGASVPDGRTSSPSGNRRQPQSSSNRSDATSILELLKGLNVPDAVLEMVSNKLNPAPPEPKPEKLLLDMRLKIDSLTKECDRLEGVVRTKTWRCIWLVRELRSRPTSCWRHSKNTMNSRNALTGLWRRLRNLHRLLLLL